ncbi:substrate-binding domain-containing protein [Lichenicoccus roseus]|nr:substrate-binding domain-containing protein [Lichenicoccus roseus]
MVALILTGAAGQARAADLHVIVANSVRAALLRIAPIYEHRTGDRIDLAAGLSGGGGPNSIPARLAHGMAADVLVILRPDLDRLVAKGLAVRGSTADIARARVASLVREDASVGDLASPAGLRAALLLAQSIVYPDGGSGAFVSHTLFRRLGVQDAVAGHMHEIKGRPIAGVVSEGRATIGFQQISEIGDVRGLRIVPLPPSLQMPDALAAGVATATRDRTASARFVAFLSSAAAQEAIVASGLGRP